MKEVVPEGVNTVSVQHYQGHRQRLRQRFRSNPKGVMDYELLEMLLFSVFPRKDTKPIAKSLLRRFGSIKAVLFASELELKQIEGIGQSVAILFELFREIFHRVSLQPLWDETIIASSIHVIQYYKNLLDNEKKEQLRAMFINNKNRLIAEEQLQQGTVNRTQIYPAEIVEKTLAYGASAIIIVHNHPSGEPKPSQEDIEVTNHLKNLLIALEIRLLDHIIIGRKGVFSFAEEGFL